MSGSILDEPHTVLPSAESTAIALSIVIPTFNGRKLLEKCLPSLETAVRSADWGRPTEIIVADDHSLDDTGAWLNLHWPLVRQISNDGPQGFTHAVNAGLAAARGTWVALLNNDVLVDEQWISAAARHFEVPQVGIVASRIMAGGPTGVVEFSGGEYTPVGIPLRCGDKAALDAAKMMEARTCFWGCGAAVFYRRAALLAVGGGLHAALEAYQEDVEVAFRLALAGWDCVYEPTSWVTHLGSATYGKASFRKKFNSARNGEIVFFSCMPAGLLGRYIAGHCLAFFLQLAGHLVRGSAAGYFCGKAVFLFRHLPATWQRRRTVQKLRRLAPQALRRKMVRNWMAALVALNRG